MRISLVGAVLVATTLSLTACGNAGSITRAGDPQAIRLALRRAFDDPALAEAREALLLVPKLRGKVAKTKL